MAITQADLDALNAAIVAQELEVEFEGSRVRYRSVAELRAAYEHAQTQLAAQAPSRRTSFQFQFTTSRGE